MRRIQQERNKVKRIVTKWGDEKVAERILGRRYRERIVRIKSQQEVKG